MTQIVDRLERDQLVRRSPDPTDRRKIIVGLTPAGLGLVKRANKAYVARKADLLDQLSAAELDQVDGAVLRLLHLFADDFDRQEAPAD